MERPKDISRNLRGKRRNRILSEIPTTDFALTFAIWNNDKKDGAALTMRSYRKMARRSADLQQNGICNGPCSK